MSIRAEQFFRSKRATIIHVQEDPCRLLIFIISVMRQIHQTQLLQLHLGPKLEQIMQPTLMLIQREKDVLRCLLLVYKDVAQYVLGRHAFAGVGLQEP